MNISLVVSTLGDRPNELHFLLDSLKAQTTKPCEVIIVAQPTADVVDISDFSDLPFPFKIVGSAPGVSRARNTGIQIAHGDVIGFPDDDCSYAPEVVERLARLFAARPDVSIVAGRALRADGTSSRLQWPTMSQALIPRNAWVTPEHVLFFRSEVFAKVGAFDPLLGRGADSPNQGAEGLDLVLRALSSGLLGAYEPEIRVHHAGRALPWKVGAAKYYTYGRSVGLVMHKNRCPLWTFAYWLVRPLVGAALSLLRGQAHLASWRLCSFAGRLRGWLAA